MAAKENWPVLGLGRLKHGDRTPEIHHGTIKYDLAYWEEEKYIPESALLSDEAIDEAVRCRNGGREPLSVERTQMREDIAAALVVTRNHDHRN